MELRQKINNESVKARPSLYAIGVMMSKNRRTKKRPTIPRRCSMRKRDSEAPGNRRSMACGKMCRPDPEDDNQPLRVYIWRI